MLVCVASCSNEMESAMGVEFPVSFAIDLGDNIDSRTISDGLKANTLKFAVFENGTEIHALAQTVAVADKKATINTKLVKGHTYSFVFWAQNSACTAYNTTDMSAITVDYAANCNDETRDAFYKMDSFTVTEAFEKTEVLTRPFAQINFLADDAAGVNDVDAYKSKVTVTGVPTTLNTLDGTVSGTTDVTFALATIPGETLAGYETYKYVAMNYILAATDKDMKDQVVLTVNDGTADVNTVTVANCPVQRNYRTNIFGSLFTLNGKFNIEINPIYGTPDYEIDMSGTYYDVNEDGGLETIMEQINAEQPVKAIVRIADGKTVTWTTGGGHGSTPLITAENTKTKEVIIEGGEGTIFKADGAGVGEIRSANASTLLHFKNLIIQDRSVSYAETAWEFLYLEISGPIKFTNCIIEDPLTLGNNRGFEANYAYNYAIFDNCKIYFNKSEVTDYNQLTTSTYLMWICDGKAEFNNCDFSGFRGIKVHNQYPNGSLVDLKFEGCVFHDINEGGKAAFDFGTIQNESKVLVKDCVFRNIEKGPYKSGQEPENVNFNFIFENNTIE